MMNKFNEDFALQRFHKAMERMLITLLVMAVFACLLVASFECEAHAETFYHTDTYVSEISYYDGMYNLEIEYKVTIDNSIQYEYYSVQLTADEYNNAGLLTIGTQLQTTFSNTNGWYNEWVVTEVMK